MKQFGTCKILFSAHKSQNVFQFLFEAIEDLFYFCFSHVNSKPSLILIHPSMFKFPFLAEAFFYFLPLTKLKMCKRLWSYTFFSKKKNPHSIHRRSFVLSFKSVSLTITIRFCVNSLRKNLTIYYLCINEPTCVPSHFRLLNFLLTLYIFTARIHVAGITWYCHYFPL